MHGLSERDMNIEIFADTADKKQMLELAKNPIIRGFTSNPSLMKKAGVTDYRAWAKDILSEITEHPISLEVIADEFDEMERQAKEISSWGRNVFVKIPITNTRGESSASLIHILSRQKIQVNVTGLMTVHQVTQAVDVLHFETPSYVSVFAGRIADTGVDPIGIMESSLSFIQGTSKLIWASPREVSNVYQAEAMGCHVITATPEILAKLPLFGKDLNEYSLETVRMFRDDAVASGLTL
jgi:transaldolase